MLNMQTDITVDYRIENEHGALLNRATAGFFRGVYVKELSELAALYKGSDYDLTQSTRERDLSHLFVDAWYEAVNT